MQPVKETPNLIPKEYCETIIERYLDYLEKNPKRNKRNDPIKEVIISDKDEWADVIERIKPLVEQQIAEYIKQFHLLTFNNYYFDYATMVYHPDKYGIQIHYDAEIAADRGYETARHFACLVYLNKNFQNGELLFPLQRIIVKPEPGLLAIFPTSYMFPHMTNPPLGSDRYIMRFNYAFNKEPILNSPREFI